MPLRYVVPLLLLAFAAGALAVPAVLDPVKVAPHIYEVAFENERVRVLKRTIRNGDTEPFMQQPDRVVVYLNACAWLDDDGEGGNTMESFEFGTPVWAPAESRGGWTSNVIQECHVIEVELKE